MSQNLPPEVRASPKEQVWACFLEELVIEKKEGGGIDTNGPDNSHRFMRCRLCLEKLDAELDLSDHMLNHLQEERSATQSSPVTAIHNISSQADNQITPHQSQSSAKPSTNSLFHVPQQTSNRRSINHINTTTTITTNNNNKIMTPANDSIKHSKEEIGFTRNSDINSSDCRRSNSKSIYVNQRHAGLDFSKWENNDDNNLIPSPYPMKQAGAGSASLGKNFISRLNELSAPVKRRLKFWTKKSFEVNQCDPTFKVIYLGNLGMQLWSKDENCLEKPLSTLWNNYLVNMKTEIVMRLTICNSGLKAITRQHGLTQYWSNRLVYCCSHKNYPRIFSWIYRHEGKKMRQEIRCHAVFCPSPDKAMKMVTMLNQRLACALQEFRREKKSHSLSLNVNSDPLSIHNTVPRAIPLRRQILAKGTTNFRPPLERSKSAPKLTPIIEDPDESESSHEEFEIEESFEDRDDDDEDEDEEESGEEEEEKDYVDEVDFSLHHNQQVRNARDRAVYADVKPNEMLNGSNLVAKLSSYAASPIAESSPSNLETTSTETIMSTTNITNTTNTSSTFTSEHSAILNESSANTTAGSSSSKTKAEKQTESTVIRETSEVSSPGDHAIPTKIDSKYPATNCGNDSGNKLDMTRPAGQAKADTIDEEGDATREVIASWSNLVIS